MTSALREPGLLSRQHLLTTLGACALVAIAAFEATGVTTAMPLVVADLGGEEYYALSFAAAVASGVVGMVAAGAWAGRRGPATPIVVFALLFGAGLLVAGTAESMPQFLVGRVVQGLGGGGISVALTVMVARAFPPVLHPRIFAAFSAAWVIPSVVGPFAAGLVAEALSWHWVFLGVLAIVPLAALLILPALRRIQGVPAPDDAVEPAGVPTWARILLAVLLAAGVIGLNLAPKAGALSWVAFTLAGAAIAVPMLLLLPAGVFRAARGLPSAILVRFFASAVFFAAEVYVPYLLMTEHGLSAHVAGLGLTCGAIAWFIASTTQGRIPLERLSNERAVRIGTSLLVLSLVVMTLGALFSWPVLAVIGGWFIAGGGMGLLSPRLSVLVLARSTPATQGTNVASSQVADSIGSSLALVASGFVFAAFGGVRTADGSGHASADGGAEAAVAAAPPIAFAAVFATSAVLAAVAWLAATRTREPR